MGCRDIKICDRCGVEQEAPVAGWVYVSVSQTWDWKVDKKWFDLWAPTSKHAELFVGALLCRRCRLKLHHWWITHKSAADRKLDRLIDERGFFQIGRKPIGGKQMSEEHQNGNHEPEPAPAPVEEPTPEPASAPEPEAPQPSAA